MPLTSARMGTSTASSRPASASSAMVAPSRWRSGPSRSAISKVPRRSSASRSAPAETRASAKKSAAGASRPSSRSIRHTARPGRAGGSVSASDSSGGRSARLVAPSPRTPFTRTSTAPRSATRGPSSSGGAGRAVQKPAGIGASSSGAPGSGRGRASSASSSASISRAAGAPRSTPPAAAIDSTSRAAASSAASVCTSGSARPRSTSARPRTPSAASRSPRGSRNSAVPACSRKAAAGTGRRWMKSSSKSSRGRRKRRPTPGSITCTRPATTLHTTTKCVSPPGRRTTTIAGSARAEGRST